jgi:hypothetical protein
MTTNGEEENLNQHRRPSLERLDEIRHRQNRISQKTKRRNGKRSQRIHERTQVRRCIICKKREEELKKLKNEEFADYSLPLDCSKTLKEIIGIKAGTKEHPIRKCYYMCKWCYWLLASWIGTNRFPMESAREDH